MKEVLGDLLRLKHISRCILDLELILNEVEPDLFYRNTEKKYAVERLLEIIGEAINRVSIATLNLSNQKIPWRDIVDFRNFITHEYFRVDYTLVYKIATEEIPKIKSAVDFLILKLEEH